MCAMQLSKRDIPDILRTVGGLLFAAGAVLLLVRKSSHHELGAFAQLLVVLIPAVTLYLLALGVLEDAQFAAVFGPGSRAEPGRNTW